MVWVFMKYLQIDIFEDVKLGKRADAHIKKWGNKNDNLRC